MSFVGVPLKKTSEVDLNKPLKNLIASFYSSSDEPVDCSEAISELNKLRMNSTWRTLDKHESSLEVMYRYYDQLSALESKCPPSDIQVNFKWRDAFDKGSFFGGYSSLSLCSLAFEKVCILFNIAAMQSQIAVSQGNELANDEALKSTAKYFQLASGIFQQLKNNVMSSLQQEPTPDLHPDTLGALQALMLAQAQESYFHKASSDKMKDHIIAKVASQCEELYSEAVKQMSKDHTKVLWEKEWPPMVGSKQSAFQAIAQYHQALVCKQNKDIGEELCRLQMAHEQIKLAEQKAGYTFNFKEYSSKIGRAYEEAKKDNDFIYHAKIPDNKSIAPIGKATLAKPLPVPDKFSTNSVDLFSALMPMAVQQALHTYDVRKAELVNGEIAKLKDATQVLNGMLTSMNLPASLEDFSGDSLPPSILEKSNIVREKGGLEVVEKLVVELPSLLGRNKEILDESDRMLKEEEDSDDQLRNQFKNRWTRRASGPLNAPLKQNSKKYRSIIDLAISADSQVQDKFRANRENILLLAKSQGELEAALPSSGASQGPNNSPTVQKLRNMMNQVEEIKREREEIEAEFKSGTTDMKSQFLSALSADGSINEVALSVETLGEVYGPVQRKARDNLVRQESLLQQIQQTNQEFCREKGDQSSQAIRETVLRDLATAYDVFVELLDNLQEGTKFYNDLTELLLAHQNKIGDFCFARKTERDELHRELQQSIANSPTGPTPTPPNHHQNAQPAAPPKPERPPAPVNPPPVSAPSTAPGPYNPYQNPGTAPAPSYNPYPGAPIPMTAPQAGVYHPTGQQQPVMPYPPQYQPYPHYPPAPMPAGYNPYGQPAVQPYQPPQGYNPYQQYPPAPSYYPQQQWR